MADMQTAVQDSFFFFLSGSPKAPTSVRDQFEHKSPPHPQLLIRTHGFTFMLYGCRCYTAVSCSSVFFFFLCFS